MHQGGPKTLKKLYDGGLEGKKTQVKGAAGQEADLTGDSLDESVEAGERDEAEALPEGQLVQELLDDVRAQLRQRALKQDRASNKVGQDQVGYSPTLS